MSSRSVRIRDAVLGEGTPEIIVPLTGTTPQSVLEQADLALTGPARLVEWRADLFAPDLPGDRHREELLFLLPLLRERIGPGRGLLLTVRTAAEGGGRTIDDGTLEKTLLAGIDASADDGSPLVDAVDIETARGRRAVDRVIEAAHGRSLAVVGSSHDFERTPAHVRITAHLREARERGADAPKIAVTPRRAEDVLTLLGASLEVAREGHGPHIAISMGPLGAVSRVAAETFGSAATFASAGEASAPGQLAAEDVAGMLEALRP
ncbi:type I 3-dehydroquinate dehydratase [Brachybacterium endophyticum]|uniref:3-dehydroquinate dehydratase n=1 Tax=Brachybacterium endophyticum TaxID=2182385 RepID=A0A2U2RIS4_9MICO|nr:type I 3-dehydroquinate dehydratase [Brachybacterium endophyticum]PWH05779.1 type I 3-dehydroquinate dehydratase [Brachybacterium endophyticum]